MNHCSNCAHPTERIVPPGDSRLRDVCRRCGEVFYQNPKISVAAIPVYGDKVLLCRRAIEPRLDCWTLPGGFLECGEGLAEGAAREALEEACAVVVDLQLYLVVNAIEASQVHIVYRARLEEPTFAPGDESLEVRLFDEEEVPWHLFAFRSLFYALDHFFKDRKRGVFPCREITLSPLPVGDFRLAGDIRK